MTTHGQILTPKEIYFWNPIFGDGSDGATTISINTTLTRTMFYSTLTINASTVLTPDGFFVLASTSITNSGQISGDGNSATNGSGGTAGSAGAALAINETGGGQVGTNGGAGGKNNGANGGLPVTASTTYRLGGTTAAGGNGGNGSVGTGGSGQSGAGGSLMKICRIEPQFAFNRRNTLGSSDGLHLALGGSGSGGAGGGGGDGVNAGGGGGGGGGGARVIALVSPIISNATGGASITANGGSGGKGGSPTAGVTGGGGGGAGGSGGAVYMWFSSFSEVTAASVRVNAGSGAAGGNGFGGGTNGATGSDGATGIIRKINLTAGTVSTS